MAKKDVQDIHMNYDSVFKESLILFKDKTLDFLGLPHIAPIVEPLRTENVEITIRSEFADLTFGLADGSGINLESEVHLSREDLLRIGSYNLWLTREYKREFRTVVFVNQPVRVRSLRTEQISFEPLIVDCSQIDGDKLLAKLKKTVAEGGEINELELIYLPLFSSKEHTSTGLFKEATALIKDLRMTEERKLKLSALSLLLAGKVVDKAQLDLFWEEVKLMKNAILEYAEERGMKHGIKLGEERGMKLNSEETARRMFAKGYDPQEISELTDITPERIREITAS